MSLLRGLVGSGPLSKTEIPRCQNYITTRDGKSSLSNTGIKDFDAPPAKRPKYAFVRQPDPPPSSSAASMNQLSTPLRTSPRIKAKAKQKQGLQETTNSSAPLSPSQATNRPTSTLSARDSSSVSDINGLDTESLEFSPICSVSFRLGKEPMKFAPAAPLQHSPQYKNMNCVPLDAMPTTLPPMVANQQHTQPLRFSQRFRPHL